MLTQERFEAIVKVVNRAGAVTVQNLAKALNTSESTIRRDLVQLDSLGRVRKVHGGATSVVQLEAVQERCMQENIIAIWRLKADCRYATSLVHANDFIFLDAGSTTEQMADFLEETSAVYVTNGITLAQKLAQTRL